MLGDCHMAKLVLLVGLLVLIVILAASPPHHSVAARHVAVTGGHDTVTDEPHPLGFHLNPDDELMAKP